MRGRAVACDVGTMFFQIAEKNKDGGIDYGCIRNAFVEIPGSEDTEDILNRNKWQYVKSGNSYYVIGEDSIQVAKMFPDKVEIRRPLASGVLNKDEDKKMLVLSQMIESSIGKAEDDVSVLATCISSPPVDSGLDSTFHKSRLEALFSRIGWNVKIIEEGLAVVLAERPVMIDPDGNEIPYTGIGISFGAGRVNCVLAYKGLQVTGMSASRSGDWIDSQVASQTGTPLAKVMHVKEKILDFNNIDYEDDIQFALDAYYGNMMQFVLSHFSKKFLEVQSEFEAPIEIVVAGGTSMPNGFCDKLKTVVDKMNLPFKVKSIRHAENPRNAVSEGLLTQAILTQEKLFLEKM